MFVKLRIEEANMNKIAMALVSVLILTGICAADAAAGKSTYVSKCGICHGPDGSGKTPMGKTLNIPDFHSAAFQKMSEADVKGIVTNGKNKMPAFKGKLTSQQIDDVVDYVRQMSK
jgi:mono/diheme cytochrome c family protein